MAGDRNDITQFEQVLANTKPEDFDGHTEFGRLTPEERLMWLSQCAEFYAECAQKTG